MREVGVDSVCDFYLLAERKFFNYSSIFIMLFEYVEGEGLSWKNLNAKIKKNINQEVKRLHSYDMVMGDIQLSNFIINGDQIRIIDCSGKKATRKRKAEDRINLERRLGIENQILDFGYFVVIAKERMRNAIREIKAFLPFFKFL